MLTPQHHPDTHSRNLTQKCYPVVSLLSSKFGVPEGFAPIPSSGELPCEGNLHKRYSHGVGFQIFLCFENVLRSEGFYRGRSAIPTTNPLKRGTQLQEDVCKTQLGTRYGQLLVHKELLHPLAGFVFNPAGCPYSNTLLIKKPGGGDGLVADNPTMEQVSTGLHDTCSKSQI